MFPEGGEKKGLQRIAMSARGLFRLRGKRCPPGKCDGYEAAEGVMKGERILISRQTWLNLMQSVKRFATAERVGGKAKGFFALLILFLLGINGLNVLNSYVGRDFMTAIEDRNRAGFIRLALIYIAVFGASTLVAVLYRYTEESLGLLWREWATRQSILNYANYRVYYRLKRQGEVENPDQRIADDNRTFSVTTLSFLLMLLNGSITVVAFSGVLWSISPRLLVVSVLYAASGTFLTYILGRPLARLNYDQLDKEANFRSALIYLRGNAESMALSRREGHLIQLSLKNLSDLAVNFRRIIAVNRNVNFFTTGYNWLIQIIPALIVAPLFIEGKAQFGVITQSAIAFTQLIGAFSLIVTQFQSISSYTATFARLGALAEAGEREKRACLAAASCAIDETRVAFQGLTLRSPRSGSILIRALSLEIPHGVCVLVQGPDETARAALFHAVGGLWEVSEGRIVRPSLENILFLPELPYLPPGTLRELFMRPWPEAEGAAESMLKALQIPEARIMETLRMLKLDALAATSGGLDKRQHWENTLPLDEQQLLVVARLLAAEPRFAFLDRPGATLNPGQIDLVLSLLRERGVSYVTFEGVDQSVNPAHYNELLELKEDGAWKLTHIKDGRIVEDASLPAQMAFKPV